MTTPRKIGTYRPYLFEKSHGLNDLSVGEHHEVGLRRFSIPRSGTGLDRPGTARYLGLLATTILGHKLSWNVAIHNKKASGICLAVDSELARFFGS